tara:strand:- start:597 stop:1232 length:636 start_codon:yes stop_codon:yes gene_type:complete
MRAKMTITKEQIKKAFVSEVKDIDDVYNNQDWYQQDAQRMRYILATIEMSPGDNYGTGKKQLELGQEDNRFYNCIEFIDRHSFKSLEGAGYKINDEKRLLELINMSESEVADYISTNEYDWLGDDYDHANEYLFQIMNEWQDEVEFDTEGYDNPDYMTVTRRARQWNVDPQTGYKSENKHEVAYNILMDYFDELPEETRAEAHKRLEAVQC